MQNILVLDWNFSYVMWTSTGYLYNTFYLKFGVILFYVDLKDMFGIHLAGIELLIWTVW